MVSALTTIWGTCEIKFTFFLSYAIGLATVFGFVENQQPALMELVQWGFAAEGKLSLIQHPTHS